MLVVIESPYAGDVEENLKYARKCMRDSLMRREYPIASHLLYTQEGILDDDIPAERILGINAGFAWLTYASKMCIYADRGISKGMSDAISRAKSLAVPIEYRYIEDE